MTSWGLPTWLLFALAGGAGIRTWVLLAHDSVGALPRTYYYRVLEALAGRGSWSPTPEHPRRAALAQSLDRLLYCPFCLGFWTTLAWLGTGLAWGDTWVWQLFAGALALNWLFANVESVLNDRSLEDE